MANRIVLDATDSSVLARQYDVEAKLGEGTYGAVYRARSKTTGAMFAIKKLRLDGLGEGVPATAIREITLLQELRHPSIVTLIDVVCCRHRLYLIFELAQEDLRSFLTRRMRDPSVMRSRDAGGAPLLEMSLVKRFTRQMLDALWYCHKSRVLHRDLKPQNVLVCESSGSCSSAPSASIKIADFGLARTFDMPLCTYTHEVVTLWYRAPEILLGEKHYTPAVDVWSVGLIVAEMVTGKPLLRGESQVDQLYKTFALVGTPTEATWPGVTQLSEYNDGFPRWAGQDLAAAVPGLDVKGHSFLAALLQCNPKSRPTVSEALAHPWLASGT